MTIRFPVPTLGDRILSKLGKKRAVFIPPVAQGKYGVYATAREPFLRSLWRPRDQSPPAGWFYPDDMM